MKFKELEIKYSIILEKIIEIRDNIRTESVKIISKNLI